MNVIYSHFSFFYRTMLINEMVVFVPILNGYVDSSSHILHLCMLYRFRLFVVHFSLRECAICLGYS